MNKSMSEATAVSVQCHTKHVPNLQ